MCDIGLFCQRKQGGTDDKFIFGIQLKEAIAALHRTYLNVSYITVGLLLT